MPQFEHNFQTPSYKGAVTFNTGLFINGKFVDGSEGKTIDVVNPSTGKVIAKVAEGTKADVDKAVAAAQTAFDTVWGTKVPGAERGKLLIRLAELLEANKDKFAAVESLDNGKPFKVSRDGDVSDAIAVFRYYGGWADKIHGNTIETVPSKLTYTLHEPIGVCGQIIPWNFPLLMVSWKIAPALATGNTVVLKPSEITPLTALYIAELINEAGFPPGVVNIVNGYGPTVGAAIAEHPHIDKVAFTGSTLVGRSIMKASASTNLKKVTLELGGKSPNIIYEDADLDEAVKWAAFGIFANKGEVCCAGSRVFVQESIYDKFIAKLSAHIKTLAIGDAFHPETFHGPQISQVQFDRVMSYIDHGKKEGAVVHTGGSRHGTEGFFIQPTVFTDVKNDMKIAQEEIFGPVVVVLKFKDEDDVVRQANNTVYGLAAAVFSRDISRALITAQRVKAGTVWVNCCLQTPAQVPFGGYKQSGIGRELGEYALANYTNVKAVQVNLSAKF